MERSRTHYASGFSASVFKAIPLGTEKAIVLKMLGEPLHRFQERTPETWLYCLPGLCPSAEDPDSPLRTPAIIFDEDGKVYDPQDNMYQPLPSGVPPLAEGPTLRPARIAFSEGLTKTQVRQFVGKPAVVLPPQTIQWWFYSGPVDPSNQNYDAWVIAIGESGRVIGKGHWKEYD